MKSKASERSLLLPPWCVELLRARRVRLGGFDGPVFPDSNGGWRDRSNVGKSFRRVRKGTEFEWVKTHTYRKTVATLLDQSGASARMIADQLGHSRVSMTQDVYLGRRASNAGNLAALEASNPDLAARRATGDDRLTMSIRPSIRPRTGFCGAPREWCRSLTCGFVGPVGIEPTTRGLKVRCSAN